MIYAIFATLLLAIRVSAQQWAQLAPTGVGPGFYSATIRPQRHRAVGADLSRGMIDFARSEYPGPSIHTDMRRLVKKPSGGLT